ncbi:MAG: alpha/beta fold hydrolase [Myxococcota bacterium]
MRLAFLVLLSGCFLSSPTPPLRFLDHTTSPAQARGLVVFLHGLGDNAASFERYGLVETAREYGWDSIAVGSHFGFYRSFSIVDRLEQDIIGPATRMGYRKIWIVGVSMGGFGALSYAQAHPEDIDGVVLFAPFLGEPAVVDEIREQGLNEWRGAMPDEDGRPRQTAKIWRWVRAQIESRETPIYLGYGTEDRGAESHAVLANELPEEWVVRRPGVHKWTTWAPLSETLFRASWNRDE